MTIRHSFFLITIFLYLNVWAQTEVINLGGAAFIDLSDQLPSTLTSERTLVVVDVPNSYKDGFEIRGDWKSLASKAHKTLRKIGVDAIAYVNQNDLNAGPEVNRAYSDLFETRKVKNLIFIQQIGSYPNENYIAVATEYFPEGFVQNGQKAWKTTDKYLDQAMVRLGKQVLRQELERSNFLIPEYPDFVQDLVVFTGNRLENYPSRLRSNKLAVVAFQHVPVESGAGSESSMSAITSYNKKIDIQNERLAVIMEAYPFKYDIVTETDEAELYDMGYQYALVPLSSTGKSIKRILNYKTNPAETHYMTSSFNAEGKVSLKKIPVGANVTKYYVKQTIVKDIHTGPVWDADVDWDQALQNFLFNLNEAF